MKEQMITKTQIKKIHTLISVLKMPDDLYRRMLKGAFEVTSSKEMTLVQARRIILILEDFARIFHRGEQSYYEAHFQDLGYRPGMANPGQLQKIEATWNRLCPHTGESQGSLRNFLNRHFKVSDMRFLDSVTAGKVLYVLKIIDAKKRKAQKGAQDARSKQDMGNHPFKTRSEKLNIV